MIMIFVVFAAIIHATPHTPPATPPVMSAFATKVAQQVAKTVTKMEDASGETSAFRAKLNELYPGAVNYEEGVVRVTHVLNKCRRHAETRELTVTLGRLLILCARFPTDVHVWRQTVSMRTRPSRSCRSAATRW